MASFTEEGVVSTQPDEVVTEVATQEPVQQVQTQEQDDGLPEKYRGKSAKEIAQMHMEAEKLIGRQGSEVGELRRVVDDYIKAQTLAKQQLHTEPVEETDFFADPNKAVAKAIDNHPKIKQAEMLSLEMRAAKAKNDILAKHPDFMDIAVDPNFQEWVKASRVRTELLVRADRQYDVDSADELFSTWKERQQVAKQTANVEKEARSQAVKTATTTVKSGSDEAPSKKVFRRSDIIKLMQTDPDKYDMMQPEIMQAYRENRVR